MRTEPHGPAAGVRTEADGPAAGVRTEADGPAAGVRTVVHVMRHGEVHNPEGLLYGRLPDYHLSDRGRAQAQTVADWLAGRDIVYVVASPLERAQETAAPGSSDPR